MRACLPIAFLFVALLAAMAEARAQDVRVEISGEVRQPGVRQLPTGSRLAAAALAAGPTAQAYPLGAALLRADAEVEQHRLKAGLLYDLEVLATFPEISPDVAARAARLRDWLEARPVTGRVHVELDPRRLELDLASNRRLASGDRFIYPPRPTTVQVVGAVAEPCTLAHVPLRSAIDYLAECPPLAGAARELLFVIQPDGTVQRLGTALWNRSAPQALAPGAVLYVPLDEREVQERVLGFNDELARFIATQLLPEATP